MTRSPRELVAQKMQMRKQQEALLKDMLAVMDALDRAADHWQQAERIALAKTTSPAPLPWWQRWRQWLSFPVPSVQDGSITVVASAREGIELIRENMREILQKHQVSPIVAQGQTFDPTQMHALGQRVETSAAPNTVVQEVVRGYRWQDRVLREAQVIVAATAKSSPKG